MSCEVVDECNPVQQRITKRLWVESNPHVYRKKPIRFIPMAKFTSKDNPHPVDIASYARMPFVGKPVAVHELNIDARLMLPERGERLGVVSRANDSQFDGILQ
jgi:hypothetical protein